MSDRWRCPSCGHEMEAGITRATIEVSFLAFCPACHTAMDRLDPLGAREAAHRSDKPETFEEFLTRPNVLRLEGNADD